MLCHADAMLIAMLMAMLQRLSNLLLQMIQT